MRQQCQRNSPGSYVCSLDAGHNGPHIALGGFDIVCEVWIEAETPTEKRLLSKFPAGYIFTQYAPYRVPAEYQYEVLDGHVFLYEIIRGKIVQTSLWCR